MTQHYENTIDFNDAYKNRSRPIDIVPKTLAQEDFYMKMLDSKNHITIAIGPAGTGKSYLAVMTALKQLRQNRIRRLVLTRPAVEVDNEKHGFLPGDLTKKMEPWTRPLLDIVKQVYHPREVMKLIEDEVIEISPLAFMRGRTFTDTWILADEMQNASPTQMKMLLTRIGVGSKIVVTGDVEQTDRTLITNGLLDLFQRAGSKQIQGLTFSQLGSSDVQRHPIINKILNLYPS